MVKSSLSQLSCLALLSLAGCFVNTQRLLTPMPADISPLPGGSLEQHPPGPEEVVVMRHADPVQLRPAGSSFGHPMPFYSKQTRANAGAWVFSGHGGRAEILWASGGSALLHGKTTVVVGSPSRGEPAFLLKELERLTLNFGSEGGARLMGGALLEALGGPFVIERRSVELMRIRNRSKVNGTLRFRDAVINLDPGSVVDVPILPMGAEPIPADPDLRDLPGEEFSISVRGAVDVEETPEGTSFTGRGEHEIQGPGLRLQLGLGERALLSGLDKIGQAPSAPAEEPEPVEEPVVVDEDEFSEVEEPEVVEVPEVVDAPEVVDEPEVIDEPEVVD
ncbi:MAG TPA: hypothetical protein QF730_05590, partial [Planctomycetota bacterium]|nr:hypothetical protein [Planctomycetota bacterium]